MPAIVVARQPNTETIEAMRKGKRISVQLDEDVAERVIAWAMRERRSISSAVNALTAKGLEAEDARDR